MRATLLCMVLCACGPVRTHQPETGFQTAEANGLTLAFFEEGTGPLVIMTHGFPDTAHTWDHIRPQVAAAGFHVVTPFLRGYTPSAIPTGADSYTSELAGKDILGLITALGEDQAYVVGHDFGAAAAYAASLLDPGKVRALVTVGIPHPGFIKVGPSFPWRARHFFYLSSPAAEAIMRRDDFQHVEALYKRWSPNWSVDPSEWEPVKNAFAMPESLTGAVSHYRAGSPVGTAFPFERKVTVPTLTFAGESDGVLNVEAFDDAREGFEGEYVVKRLPGGHFLQRENEAPLVAELLAFLAAHP